MTFLSSLALAAALLVVAPYLAHRLRRRKAEEQPFPPARLVEPASPKVRRRSRLEDRALFATRAASVVALAVLGATPFVRCSRLALQRSGGASVAMALVIDDSMSMRAAAGGKSRFELARDGARELLASAREGDAVALVLAGAPARIALAATTDLGAARSCIDALQPSDRATDLDGAIVMAQGLVATLPQVDHRVVVLSDLADGHAGGPPLGRSSGIPIWVAMPELRVAGSDCALVRADRSGVRVRVAVACGPGASATDREILVVDAQGKALARAPAPVGSNAEVVVLLASDAAKPVEARLGGVDAIGTDDAAPVVSEAGRGSIAVIADTTDEAVVTGGAPIVEQALSALKLDVDVRPIPAFPDRAEDLASYLGVLLDDPPGLTPEQRHALGIFLDDGGFVLVALGPRAAAAPLGATLDPMISHGVSWSDTTQPGADPASAVGSLVESAPSLTELGASRRASLSQEDSAAFDPLLQWTDGTPLVARRPIGRGETWIVTLPFSVDTSDLTLRPAFLALLEGWVRAARERAVPQRSDVGTPWIFPRARDIEVQGPAGAVVVKRDNGVARVTPSLIGTYRIRVDGKAESRVAAPAVRELDLRPRPVDSSARGQGLGERRASVDISAEVALALLAFVALEMALRLWSRARMAASA